jgi:hypothetical protein
LRPKAVLCCGLVELEIGTGGADTGHYPCELLDRLQSCRRWNGEPKNEIPRTIAILKVRLLRWIAVGMNSVIPYSCSQRILIESFLSFSTVSRLRYLSAGKLNTDHDILCHDYADLCDPTNTDSIYFTLVRYRFMLNHRTA